MTIKITRPISATDLKKLMAYQLPKPKLGERRYLVAYFTWGGESGCMVRSLSVHQPNLKDLSGDRYRVLRLWFDETSEPEETDPPLPHRQVWPHATPLLTARGKPKLYKTMDAFYRDMKSIAGERSTVVLYEWSTDEV